MKWFLIVLSVVSLVAGQNDTWPTIPVSILFSSSSPKKFNECFCLLHPSLLLPHPATTPLIHRLFLANERNRVRFHGKRPFINTTPMDECTDLVAGRWSIRCGSWLRRIVSFGQRPALKFVWAAPMLTPCPTMNSPITASSTRSTRPSLTISPCCGCHTHQVVQEWHQFSTPTNSGAI